MKLVVGFWLSTFRFSEINCVHIKADYQQPIADSSQHYITQKYEDLVNAESEIFLIPQSHWLKTHFLNLFALICTINSF